MLFKIADTTENFYISKYFGKIPIITSDGGSDIDATPELPAIDSDLEENMQLLKTLSGLLSSLQPYAMAFSYLNKESQQLSAVLNKNHFLDYLDETANHNQTNTAKPSVPGQVRQKFGITKYMRAVRKPISCHQQLSVKMIAI
jgi:hypothetical protein